MRIKVRNNSLFKILKIKNGLTISEITQDKIHRATYNYIETGHTKYVHPKTAKILCESFQKTFDELFEIVEERSGIS